MCRGLRVTFTFVTAALVSAAPLVAHTLPRQYSDEYRTALARATVPATASAEADASLELEPGWICPGDPYSIRWSGITNAQLARTAGGRTDRFALSGPLRLFAQETTTLAVIGPDGASLATETVSVHPDRMEHNFIRPVSTCAGRLAVVSMAIPPKAGSDRITPRRVTNSGRDAVTVTHRSVSVRLVPGESTDLFNHLPFTGDWGVVVDTGVSNPYCPPGQTPPPPVDILIVTACTGVSNRSSP